MKVLVTGGSSKLAQCIKNQFNCEVDNPSRRDLDLNDLQSIDTFAGNSVKQYTHIILNGYGRSGEFSNYNSIAEFNKTKEVYLNSSINSMVNQLYLLNKFKSSLICSVFMITGVDFIADNRSYNNYRTMKSFGRDLVFRYIINEHPESKCIGIHPGHLTTEEEYATAATKINSLISNHVDINNLHTYHFNKNATTLIEDNSSVKFTGN